MTKKIIITTGGTGGHIYPALAVGKKLLSRGMEVLFVGSSTRMEKDLVPEEGIKFLGIDVYPFQNLKKILSNTSLLLLLPTTWNTPSRTRKSI